MVKCSAFLCALLRVPPTFCLTRRREDAKSLVEMHAIEVKGNRHLTFLPATRAFQAYAQGQPQKVQDSNRKTNQHT